jgi:hypothetical protein
MTDLNYLLARRQLSIFASDHAACDASRATHQAFALAYANRIEAVQIELGSLAPMTLGHSR